LFIYTDITLAPPTNVEVTVLTPRSVKVTWNPPSSSSSSNVIGYLISYTTTASYTMNGRMTVNGGSTTSYTLTSLEENTLYTITVQAIGNGTRSPNSNEVSVRTYTAGK